MIIKQENKKLSTKNIRRILKSMKFMIFFLIMVKVSQNYEIILTIPFTKHIK